jgi:hypothetical protein
MCYYKDKIKYYVLSTQQQILLIQLQGIFTITFSF